MGISLAPVDKLNTNPWRGHTTQRVGEEDDTRGEEDDVEEKVEEPPIPIVVVVVVVVVGVLNEPVVVPWK